MTATDGERAARINVPRRRRMGAQRESPGVCEPRSYLAPVMRSNAAPCSSLSGLFKVTLSSPNSLGARDTAGAWCSTAQTIDGARSGLDLAQTLW